MYLKVKGDHSTAMPGAGFCLHSVQPFQVLEDGGQKMTQSFGREDVSEDSRNKRSAPGSLRHQQTHIS